MSEPTEVFITRRTSFISPRRIAVIAGHTFTQLVRMKVFYFLIIFAVIFWALNHFLFSSMTGNNASEQELRLLKSTSFFAMNLFAVVMSIAATALLIPKDIEDRTLYTILCKPVPRLDYLIGKLFGVLLLIFISLFLMDLLMSTALHFKCQGLIEYESEMLGRRYSQEIVDSRAAELAKHGHTMSIHYAVIAIFLKAAVIASIALLISTFSTSTIFTLILTIMVVLIGMMQADAREFVMKGTHYGEFKMLSKFSYFIAIMIPDFQFMSIDDGVIDGNKVPYTIIIKIAIVAFFYVAIYTVLSWFTFRKKEF